jgi:hypothetical protein
MKRIFFAFGIAYKRDCQGGRHTRLSNGVVI